jgi:hypothetical protein
VSKSSSSADDAAEATEASEAPHAADVADELFESPDEAEAAEVADAASHRPRYSEAAEVPDRPIGDAASAMVSFEDFIAEEMVTAEEMDMVTSEDADEAAERAAEIERDMFGDDDDDDDDAELAPAAAVAPGLIVEDFLFFTNQVYLEGFLLNILKTINDSRPPWVHPVCSQRFPQPQAFSSH